jgi:hypothetical protein
MASLNLYEDDIDTLLAYGLSPQEVLAVQPDFGAPPTPPGVSADQRSRMADAVGLGGALNASGRASVNEMFAGFFGGLGAQGLSSDYYDAAQHERWLRDQYLAGHPDSTAALLATRAAGMAPAVGAAIATRRPGLVFTAEGAARGGAAPGGEFDFEGSMEGGAQGAGSVLALRGLGALGKAFPVAKVLAPAALGTAAYQLSDGTETERRADTIEWGLMGALGTRTLTPNSNGRAFGVPVGAEMRMGLKPSDIAGRRGRSGETVESKPSTLDDAIEATNARSQGARVVARAESSGRPRPADAPVVGSRLDVAFSVAELGRINAKPAPKGATGAAPRPSAVRKPGAPAVKPDWPTMRRIEGAAAPVAAKYPRPSYGTLVRWAEENSDQRHWYEQGQAKIQEYHGGQATTLADGREIDDPALMTNLLAATSPQRDPVQNLGIALKALVAIKQGKKIVPIVKGYTPKSDEAMIPGATRSVSIMLRDIQNGHTVDQWKPPASKAKKQEGESDYEHIMRTASRAKVYSFFHNLSGDGDFVTGDLWMARLMLGDDKVGSGSNYKKIVGRVREVADRLGWDPKQVQASLWYKERRAWAERAQQEMALLQNLKPDKARMLSQSKPGPRAMALLQTYLDGLRDTKPADRSATQSTHLGLLEEYADTGKWSPKMRSVAGALSAQMSKDRARWLSPATYASAYESKTPGVQAGLEALATLTRPADPAAHERHETSVPVELSLPEGATDADPVLDAIQDLYKGLTHQPALQRELVGLVLRDRAAVAAHWSNIEPDAVAVADLSKNLWLDEGNVSGRITVENQSNLREGVFSEIMAAINYQSGVISFRPNADHPNPKLGLSVYGAGMENESTRTRVYQVLRREFEARKLHIPDGFTATAVGGQPGFLSLYIGRQAEFNKDTRTWVDGPPLPWESVDASGKTGTESTADTIRGSMSKQTFVKKMNAAVDAASKALNLDLEASYGEYEALFHFNETPQDGEGPVRRLEAAGRNAAAKLVRGFLQGPEKERLRELLATALEYGRALQYGDDPQVEKRTEPFDFLNPGTDPTLERGRLKPVLIEHFKSKALEAVSKRALDDWARVRAGWSVRAGWKK